MDILQLCIKPPVPPVDGGTLAMNSVTQGLMALGHNVKVLTVCSDKHPMRNDAIDATYRQRTGIEAVYIDLSIKPLDAAVALLCGESYNVKRFISKSFEKKLVEILDSSHFDVIHVESIFLSPYIEVIRKHSDALLVLRAHNVEHTIWSQMAKSCRNPLKRWYLKKLALALKLYETERINHYDGIACITQNDADLFRKAGCTRPLSVIPFGVGTAPLENMEPDPNALFHIGSMDWKPNQEGIRWFIDKVWPLIHSRMPQLQFFVAGRRMPDDLMKLELDGIRVVGEVEDSARFIASKQINIVPLLAGSGIRVKIIEAMSMGKTVITTTVGAQGIECADGTHLLIADTPQQFADQLQRCTDNPELCRQIGQNARRLIEEKYSNTAISKCLVDFYNKIMN